jgi:hypothetical protein
MTEHAEMYASLQQWSFAGSDEPLPSQVRLHTGSCELCASYLKQVLDAREVGRSLPTLPLLPGRRDSLKLQLMAEAKRYSNDARRRRSPLGKLAKRSVVLSLALGAVAAASIGVVAYRSSEQKPPVSLPTTPSRVVGLDPATVSSFERPATAETAASAPVVQPETPVRRKVSASNGGARSLDHAPSDADEQFATAWSSLRANRTAQAAGQFDGLLERGGLDAARRSDVLYWSAQAHYRAGNTGAACARSRRLLSEFPKSPFAPNAALLLGEVALANRQVEQAKPYLLLAKTSRQALVRERAEHALAQLKSGVP